MLLHGDEVLNYHRGQIMHCEITKQTFRALVSIDDGCVKIERREGYEKLTYFVHGVYVHQVINFVSSNFPQYYIEDINA